jgi:hypothetical protein
MGVRVNTEINLGHILVMASMMVAAVAWSGKVETKIEAGDHQTKLEIMSVKSELQVSDSMMQSQLAQTAQILNDMERRIGKNENNIDVNREKIDKK